MTEFDFRGDTTRNEVQIDLDKFLTLQNTISEQREIIRSHEENYNPWDKFIKFGQAIDAWRPWPRAFMVLYGYLIWYVIDWYMKLGAPTTQHATLVTAVVGLAPAWFGFYVNSGGAKKE